jgi:hypothetical protein
MAAMQPEFKDETPINPFDFWQGADFKVKIRKVDGYWNYDKSEFSRPGTLGNLDDDQLEAIWKREYSLTEFTNENNFKTFEELEARLNAVLNSRPQPSRRIDEEVQEEEIISRPSAPSSWSEEVSNFRSNVSAPAPAPSLPSFGNDEEDDDLSYFARLAEED